jgi:hypothetical protein
MDDMGTIGLTITYVTGVLLWAMFGGSCYEGADEHPDKEKVYRRRGARMLLTAPIWPLALAFLIGYAIVGHLPGAIRTLLTDAR